MKDSSAQLRTLAKGAKLDNRSLETKLALRAWLLGKMAITSVRVLDTCAGSGHVWGAMRQRIAVEQWVRCDIKARQAGTLQLDATDAVKSLPVASFNVVDIDPYGLPWEPYMALLERIREGTVTEPMAVFLTCGRMAIMRANLPTMKAVGIPRSWARDLPRSAYVNDYIGGRILSSTWNAADITHAARVTMPRSNVTYYAVGLAPR